MGTNPVKLDLDAILPQQGEVTLGGKLYLVDQPTIENLAYMSRLVSQIGHDNQNEGDVAETLTELSSFWQQVIPGLHAQLTLEQSMALVKFLFDLATPPEARLNAEQGITPTAEKKTTDTANS